MEQEKTHYIFLKIVDEPYRPWAQGSYFYIGNKKFYRPPIDSHKMFFGTYDEALIECEKLNAKSSV